MMIENLESLYVEAQSALKRKEYDRAAGLLTQIIAVDENYKDVSRLLAQAVRLKRRRWYSHPALWTMLIFAAVIGLGTWILPRLPSQPAQEETSAPAVSPISSPATTMISTPTNIPTIAPSPMPTAIPLTWKRISMGQDLERDSVTAFATDKNDPDVIYAGMRNSGIYKTIDGGLSWFPSHTGLSNAQVESLLIDSQNPRILYAGTLGGIFKTEDGGENWFKIGNGTYLLMDWQDGSHIYARDENGIYETRDQGNTWSIAYQINGNCPDTVNSWAIHPENASVLLLSGGKKCDLGLYLSEDSGQSWELIKVDGSFRTGGVLIRPDEQGSEVIYAHAFLPGGSGIYTSRDRGLTGSVLSEANFGCDFFVSDPERPSKIYCASRRVYVSNKVGDSWRAVPGTYSKMYTTIHVDHPYSDVTRILAGANDVSKTSDPNIGVFISLDGGNVWTQQDNGLGLSRSEIKIDPLDNARVYLSTYIGDAENPHHVSGSFARCLLYRSEDAGSAWSLIKWQGGDWCGPVFDAAHLLYMIEQSALQKSFDGGDTWLWDWELTRTATEQFLDKSAPYWLPSFEEGGSQSVSANPYFDGYVYAVGDEIYYSADAGLSWQLSEGSEGSWDARLFYTDQSKIIFDIGRYQQKYSADNGKTWQPCGASVATSRSDTRMTLDLQGERLYLATPGQGVLISADQCQSWTPSNNGLTNLHVNTLAIDPNNINTVYAGTDGGAYISYDAGATWGQVNDGLLGATVVYSIAADKEGKVYAATPYGVFRLESK